MKLKEYLLNENKSKDFIRMIKKIGFIPSTEKNLNKYISFSIQDKRESDVYHSNEKMWVVIKSSIQDEYVVRYFSSYTNYGDDDKYYGWTNGQNNWDNYYKSVHGDKESVILFLPN